MMTTNQGLSFAKIKEIVAQRVANAIETIAIYETKTRVAHDLINQVERQEEKIEDNASNKRKWEGDHGGSSSQYKGHKVIRACAVGPSNKKCNNCKRIGHQTRDCRAPVPATKLRPPVAKQKTEVTCYKCGRLGYYKSDCPKWKNQNQVNKQWKGKASGDSSVMTNNVNA
ncbi:reverse transcriptase domain-containing protein [Tanacetum coccineum]